MKGSKLHDSDRNLLVAQLVFQEAVVRHRAEKTPLTHQMVLEAQQDLISARRNSILESWQGGEGHSRFVCPRCQGRQIVHVWANVGASAENPPDWAERFARPEVAGVTRYECEDCDFKLVYVSNQ